MWLMLIRTGFRIFFQKKRFQICKQKNSSVIVSGKERRSSDVPPSQPASRSLDGWMDYHFYQSVLCYFFCQEKNKQWKAIWTRRVCCHASYTCFFWVLIHIYFLSRRFSVSLFPKNRPPPGIIGQSMGTPTLRPDRSRYDTRVLVGLVRVCDVMMAGGNKKNSLEAETDFKPMPVLFIVAGPFPCLVGGLVFSFFFWGGGTCC